MRTTTALRRRSTLLIASLVVALAAVAWLHQWHRARVAAGAWHEIQLERQRHETLHAATTRALAAARDDIARLQSAATAQPAATAAPPAPAGGAALHPLLEEHPEWRPIHEASEKAAFQQRYAALLPTLALSPAQRDGFITALLRHQEREADARATAQRHRWPPEDPRLTELFALEKIRHERELAALLGETGQRQFEAFERSLPIRPFVEELAERLYYTDEPLTPATAAQVTQALARHGTNRAGKIERRALDWDASLAELRGVLSPRQLGELRHVREGGELQAQMNRIVGRAMRKQ